MLANGLFKKDFAAFLLRTETFCFISREKWGRLDMLLITQTLVTPPVVKVISNALISTRIILQFSFSALWARHYGWSRVFSSVCSVLHLTCVCLISYALSASWSCWFSLRKGVILFTLVVKLRTGCNKIRCKFVMSLSMSHMIFNFGIYLLCLLRSFRLFWSFHLDHFARFGGFVSASLLCCFGF